MYTFDKYFWLNIMNTNTTKQCLFSPISAMTSYY